MRERERMGGRERGIEVVGIGTRGRNERRKRDEAGNKKKKVCTRIMCVCVYIKDEDGYSQGREILE